MKEVKDKINNLIASDIENYLVEHPNFFQARGKLLESLSLTKDDGNTISLVERQIKNLREQNGIMKTQLSDLITAAERNNTIFDKCRSLVMKLISTDDSREFFSVIEKSFNHEFKSASYSLIIFGKNQKRINHFTSIVSEDYASDYIDELMQTEGPDMGALKSTEKQFLFGPTADKVRSSAILPIRNQNKLIAMLSIGSEEENYFEPDLGTLFIGFLADVLGMVIPRLPEK